MITICRRYNLEIVSGAQRKKSQATINKRRVFFLVTAVRYCMCACVGRFWIRAIRVAIKARISVHGIKVARNSVCVASEPGDVRNSIGVSVCQSVRTPFTHSVLPAVESELKFEESHRARQRQKQRRFFHCLFTSTRASGFIRAQQKKNINKVQNTQ